MAVDLLGKMKDFWTTEAIQQLSVMLDEQPDRVGQALSLGAPTILAGLLKAATGTADARPLVDLVKREPEEMARFGGLSGLLNHLAGLGDVVGLDPLVQYGRSALRSIFGDRLDRVLDLVAADSGAKAPTAAALMSLLAPALMGMIRKETAAHGLTADGLRDFLMAQRDSIAALAPGKLAEALGVRNLADLGVTREPTRATTSDPVPPFHTSVHRAAPVARGPSPTRWAIPLALGILAVAAGYFLLPQANPPGTEADQMKDAALDPRADDAGRPLAGPAADPVRDAKEKAVETAQTGAPAIPQVDVVESATTADGRPIVETGTRRISVALPDGPAVEVQAGSYLEAVIMMLRKKTSETAQTFSADELVFDEDCKLTADAAMSAKHLATIAKAYPKAKLKIEARETPGGADDQAERKSTAQKRADAVRDVLIEAGVPAERVTAEVDVADELDTPDLTKKAAAVDVVITP